MNNDLEFIIDESSRWWTIEKDLNGSFIWSSPSASIKINNDDIKFITLVIEYHSYLSRVIHINSKEIHLNDGDNEIKIECDKCKVINVLADPYIPSEINSKNSDSRPLGIKLKKIKVWYDSIFNDYINVDDIQMVYDLNNYSIFTSKLNENGYLVNVNNITSSPSIIVPKKTAIFLFIDKPYKTIFETLSKYKIGNKYELIIVSDNEEICKNNDAIIKVKNCQIEHPNQNYRKTYANAKAFVNIVQIAKSRNIEIFCLIEWDCLVNKDFWFDILLDEHLSWKNEAVISGTPIATPAIHNNIKQGYNLHYLMQHYTSEYIKDCKVAMGNIPHHRNSMFFINGGFSFYKTSEMVEYFEDYEMETMRMGFDVYIGTKAFSKYKEKVFEKCAWLKSSFSGGNPYFIYTHEQRMTMLNSGLKIAIHPYKVF